MGRAAARSAKARSARVLNPEAGPKEKMNMADQVIAVLGGTGAQGGGVVDALLKGRRFRTRVAVRDPESDAAQSLAKRGVELVKADLLDIGSMRPVFEGAYGAFVVTNFWDPAQTQSRRPPSVRRS